MAKPKKPVSGPLRSVVIAVDRAILWMSRRWLLVFSLLVGTYVSVPFLAPILMNAGLTGPATVIYKVYSPFCHQFAYRSWFLFGEEPFYMAPEFEERTGIDPYTNTGRFAARNFYGTPEMGYKVAYCERDVAIYAGILLAGLIYGGLRSRGVRVRPLHWLLYGLIGIGPIALDGFSQLLAQPPFSLPFLPFRESTPFLRSLTGFLFGTMNVWLAYPYVEESMVEIKAELAAKFKRAGLAT